MPLPIEGWRAVLLTLFALTVGTPVNGAEDQGVQLASVCASCHRPDGRDGPSISGMSANDLKSAMWVFRSDDSSNPVMHAVSLTFSEAEIAIIAEQLSHAGSPPKP